MFVEGKASSLAKVDDPLRFSKENPWVAKMMIRVTHETYEQ